MNRAAVKMANIDSAFDNMFTEPKHKSGVSFYDFILYELYNEDFMDLLVSL